MPSSLAETEAVTALGGYHATRHDDSPQPPPQGEISFGFAPTPVAKPETLPFSETEIVVQNQIRTAITGLRTGLPSGLRFPGCVFCYTGERTTGEHRQPGERIAIVDNAGKMVMMEAFEQNCWGEWDLDTAKTVPTTGMDVRCYAIELMTIIADRFKKVKLPIAKDRKTLKAVKRDLRTITEAKQAISDLLARPVQSDDFAA
ncbi:MAG: hypothetical protein ABSE17_03155 [Candidatus Levyibacteriota bacterium]|jgi:hypothetical protein